MKKNAKSKQREERMENLRKPLIFNDFDHKLDSIDQSFLPLAQIPFSINEWELNTKKNNSILKKKMKALRLDRIEWKFCGSREWESLMKMSRTWKRIWMKLLLFIRIIMKIVKIIVQLNLFVMILVFFFLDSNQEPHSYSQFSYTLLFVYRFQNFFSFGLLFHI